MDTGELLATYKGNVRVQTEEEIENSKKYFNKKDAEEIGGRINSLYEKRGPFIWNIHSTAQQLFPEITPASLTRLMFISTYLGYNGFLVADSKRPLNKNDLEIYLNVDRRTFHRFWNEMTKAKLLNEYDGKIYLNEQMFSRGRLKKDKIKDLSEDGQYITRIYINGVRSLYNTATVNSHKTLSYIFRILPYVNQEYNICCFNPLEKDKDKIQVMSLGDFADIVGYDRAHISRLASTLFSPIFEVDGKMHSAMRYVVSDGFRKETYSMFINPCVYYAGSHWRDVEILCSF